MFAKLLKYEWRATRPLLGLLCAVSLSAAVLGGLAARYLIWLSGPAGELGSELGIVLCVLSMLAAVMAIGVCAVAMQFLAVWRFYKSRFTDEGYLTFTLPATSHEILLSSLVNCLIAMVIGVVTAAASVVGLVMVAFTALDGFYDTLWQELPRLLEMLGQALSQAEMGYVWLALLDMVCGALLGVVTMLLSVTIGSLIAKKHKVLAAVGVYYGIQVAISMLTGVLAATQALRAVQGASAGSMAAGMFGSGAALMLAIAIGGYFLMHHLVDRKLNLN